MNRRPLLPLVVALAGSLVSGCASHSPAGSLLPGVPSSTSPAVSTMSYENGGPKGSVDVNLSMKPGAGIDLTKVFPNLKAPHPEARWARPNVTSYKSLEIDGSIFPSYAGPVPVNNTVTIAYPAGGVATVTESFTNVPLGNNEFAVFFLYGIGNDGTKVSLGNLATLVNVTASNPKIAANAASTVVFQATEAEVQAGQITAFDLQGIKTLPTMVQNELNVLSLKPSPSTGVLSPSQLTQLITSWKNTWVREFDVTPANGANYLTVANDTTSNAENVLYYNEQSFVMTTNVSSYRPYGAPCGVPVINPHLPNTKPTVSSVSCYASWPVCCGNTEPVIDVYGGPLILGQVQYSTPMYASNVKVGTHSGSTITNISMPAMHDVSQALVINDPFDWAFKLNPSLQRNLAPGMQPVGPNANSGWSTEVPNNWSQGNPSVEALAWNPWNLPNSDFQYCTWQQTCIAAGSNLTLNVSPPFWDPGTDIKYFNWVGNQGTTVQADPAGGCSAKVGYQLSFSNNAFSMSTVNTHGTIWLAPGQELAFYFDGNGCAPDPQYTTITVTAQGADGHTYQNTGTNYNLAGNGFAVYMSSVTKPTAINAITISGTVPNASAQTLDLEEIYYPSYYYVSAAKPAVAGAHELPAYSPHLPAGIQPAGLR